jgi:hypothetical protein
MPRPLSEIVAYELPCRCGQVLHGQRRPSWQILACPRCGRKRFLLPNSPWFADSAGSTAEPTAFLTPGRFLLVILVGGSLAMGLIFLLVRPYLHRPGAPLPEASAPGDSRSSLAAGERNLREGNVHLALRMLNAAIDQSERQGATLSREEHQQVEQLRRECGLLAHLLDHSLEEIVQLALQHHDDDEWKAKFADFRGRTVIFEDVLRRDAQGRPTLSFYAVRVGDIEARVAVDDLQLLGQLPLDPPQRWLFGGRLADCRREEGGRWVLHFEPNSGVLLTDETAAAACCPAPLEEDLRAVLRRQKQWLQR